MVQKSERSDQLHTQNGQTCNYALLNRPNLILVTGEFHIDARIGLFCRALADNHKCDATLKGGAECDPENKSSFCFALPQQFTFT